MQKLLELEKKLKEAKAELEKNGTRFTGAGSTTATGGASIASQIGFGKAEEDKEKKDKKHPDEKEDKKMIAEALDRHNEKKHGEDKDEDSAKKDMDLKKAVNPTTDKVQRIAPGARQPVKEYHGMSGGQAVNTIKSPHAQEADIKNLKEAKATAAKTKAEAEAAARRSKYRQDGVLKTELIKFDKNGQWSMKEKEDDKDEDRKDDK